MSDPSPLVHAPFQARSLKTLEAITKATEELLASRAFDDITVADIVRRARCSTGSFYARFSSKDDLLPYLYERYDRDLRPRIEARVGAVDWAALSLRETVEAVVDHTIDMYVGRRHLLRAVALYARLRPHAIGKEMRRKRQEATDMPAKLLARFGREIAHDDPLEAARTGFFMMAAVAREKVLFGEAPHAAATPMTNERLKAELARAFHSYLVCR